MGWNCSALSDSAVRRSAPKTSASPGKPVPFHYGGAGSLCLCYPKSVNFEPCRVAMKVRITFLGVMLSVGCRMVLSSSGASMRIAMNIGLLTRKERLLLLSFRFCLFTIRRNTLCPVGQATYSPLPNNQMSGATQGDTPDAAADRQSQYKKHGYAN